MFSAAPPAALFFCGVLSLPGERLGRSDAPLDNAARNPQNSRDLAANARRSLKDAPLISARSGPLATLLVLNGPNLNLLGTREPGIYGNETLADIEARLRAQAEAAGHRLEFVQSNAEHELVGRIHRARSDGTAFIVFNPAAFTHTSVALRDALLAVGIPFIEVHLSNVHAREPFRHRSYFSDVAVGVITGLGSQGYELALAAALRRLDATPT
jgi:3-dehydroquinate dehydratase-2